MRADKSTAEIYLLRLKGSLYGSSFLKSFRIPLSVFYSLLRFYLSEFHLYTMNS